MPIDVRIRQQEPMVDRVRMERVPRRRIARLEFLPFIDENIPSEPNLSTPMWSIFVSAFESGHEVFPGTQTSNQISGILKEY